jgi:hypothetical protein
MASVFRQSLILQKFLFFRLGVPELWTRQDVLVRLKEAEGAEWGEQSPFLGPLLALRLRGEPDRFLTNEALRALDADLVGITTRLGGPRWLYFQYLSLLLAGIALDALYRDRDGLLAALNQTIAEHNRAREGQARAGKGKGATRGKGELGTLPPLVDKDLMRLCCWQATGSGKTLVLHANRLQALLYSRRYAQENLERRPQAVELQPPQRVILLAPNSGLVEQHVAEAQRLGVTVRPFVKGQLFDRVVDGEDAILGLSIHQLTAPGGTAGATTVPPEMFEGRNLVLVDEGHRGSTSADGKWRQIREALSQKGLVMEYSATFEQAAKTPEMFNHYARSVFIDYSYPRFHGDGYGKHYRVLNLQDKGDTAPQAQDDYYTAAIVAFFQQLLMFELHGAWMKEHNIARPLMLFAGSTVVGNAQDDPKTLDPAEQTDIVRVLTFFGRLCSGDAVALKTLGDVLNGRAGLLTKKDEDVFQTWFRELPNRDPKTVHAELLRRVFRAPGPGPVLLDVLTHKDATGEVSVRVLGGEPFGVINVGEPKRLVALVEGLEAQDQSRVRLDTSRFAGGSLFKTLKREDCPLTMLVGSRKFTEGWSSWRVSQIGLLNIGKAEGTQVIQLFGRGVRLKGKGERLKRFSGPWSQGNNDVVGTEQSVLRVVETLNVFAVNADYLKDFKTIVEEVTGGEAEAPPPTMELTVPVRARRTFVGLRVPQEPPHAAFLADLTISLDPWPRDPPTIPPQFAPPKDAPHITVDFTPRVQQAGDATAAATTTLGDLGLIPLFVDHDALYQRLLELKGKARGDAVRPLNLVLPRFVQHPDTEEWMPLTAALLKAKQGNFTVRLPPRYLQPGEVQGLQHLGLWQEIAERLVLGYARELVDHVRGRWLTAHSQLTTMEALPKARQDALIFDGFSEGKASYQLTVPEALREVANRWVKDIQEAIDGDAQRTLPLGGYSTSALVHPPSLFHPLLCQRGDKQEISVRPVALNDGEQDFVERLQGYLNTPQGKAAIGDGEVVVLRNIAKSGLGLYVGGRFYPDFLVWVIKGEKQWLIFVDPKGLMHLIGPNDPKVRVNKDLRCLEKRIGGGKTFIESWIWSVTPREKAAERGFNGEYLKNNIVFREDSLEQCIAPLFARAALG